MQNQSNNVNQDEINHFDILASQWWDKDGPMCTLHHINPTRLDYIMAQTGPLHGMQCLDIGCGGGILTEAMAQQRAIVTGIDLAQHAIKAGQEHAKQHQLDVAYHYCSAEAWAEEHAASYDIVTCCELLEHVPNPQTLIEAAAKLCKPGGTLVFSTINRTLWAYTSLIVAGEYMLNLIPKNTHQYDQFIKPSELAKACRNAELEVTDIQGMQYNPISHKAWLSDNTASNYFLTARKTP